MMNNLRLYKHIANTDVAIEILSRFCVKETDTWAFEVSWWRVSAARGKVLYPLGVTQRIKIPREKWQTEWELFPTSDETASKPSSSANEQQHRR